MHIDPLRSNSLLVDPILFLLSLILSPPPTTHFPPISPSTAATEPINTVAVTPELEDLLLMAAHKVCRSWRTSHDDA